MEGILEMSKPELLAALGTDSGEFDRWATAERERCRRERIRALDAALGACFLSIMEQYWRSLCGCWSQRASGRKPDAWLKDHWLLTLNAWGDFVARSGIGADSRPDPRAASAAPGSELSPFGEMLRARKAQPRHEPGHLPFGFVRPWL